MNDKSKWIADRCKCDNSGWVQAWKLDDDYHYAFKCTCVYGIHLSKQIPEWNDSLLKTYSLQSPYERRKKVDY